MKSQKIRWCSAVLTAALCIASGTSQLPGQSGSAHADGVNEEYEDRADPAPDTPDVPPYRVEMVTVAATAGMGDPMLSTVPLERQGLSDAQATTGTVQQVCFAFGRTASDVINHRMLPGTQATFDFVKKTFGWPLAGTTGACRERGTDNPNDNCNSQLYPDNVDITFWSDCWSNHAAGRAVDVCVENGCRQQVPSAAGTANGIALVNWLLAPDAAGNKQVRARRMGIQQVLFNSHCWAANESDDLAKTNYTQLDSCSIPGHENHVHIDLTIAGAKGLTSAYGAPPVTRSTPLAAVQSNTGLLYSVAQDGTGSNRGFGMATGTSPSMAATAAGHVIAFQSNTGLLYTLTQDGTLLNRGFGMAPGTSPSVTATATGYVVAFQANTGVLWTMTDNGVGSNRGFGMRSATSPSVAATATGYVVAFQANTSVLWTMTDNGIGSNRGLGMAGGTSPSVAQTATGYAVAFQANTSVLWTMTDNGIGSNRGLGMATGSSPSMHRTASGYVVGFQANTGVLWTMTDNGIGSNRGLGMATGSSAAV